LAIHPGGPSDLIIIDRIVTDKASDVDLSLRDFFRSLPIQSQSKVAVIHRVDRMNARAANALLKTLEEPLPHAKIILTTSEIGSVLPTIRSRCLNVACELPATDPAAADSATMQKLAAGSPGQYQQLMEVRPVIEELERWLDDLSVAPPVAAIQLAERLAAMADEIQKIEGTTARFADARVLSYLAPLLAQNALFPPEAIQGVLATHRAIIGNANPTISMDALVTSLFAQRKRPNR
jgi:DNA polymerase-3 subunit delta'